VLCCHCGRRSKAQGSVGKLWLERVGVFVIANIRGGGEFGPDWHNAGMRAGKKLGHDDFAAIDKDLIARLVTLPQRLAGKGGSNGGHSRWQYAYALSGPVRTHQLRRAALDMKRYTNLTAGSSWVSEYAMRRIGFFCRIIALPSRRTAPKLSADSAHHLGSR
jgi:prolyl oligopeptidase